MKDELTIVFSVFIMFSLSGCYSIARYESTVRPETVKPSATVTGKYRLERILLHKNSFNVLTKDEFVNACWWSEASGKFRDNETLKTRYINKAKTEIKPEELLKKIEEDPKAFDAFTHDYNKDFPFLNNAILKMSHDYHAAVESNDVENKAKIVNDIVEGYCENRALMNLVNDERRKGDPDIIRKSDIIKKQSYNTLTKISRDKACEKIFFDAVQASLLKNYPNIFTTSKDAVPLTVLVSFDSKFGEHHTIGLILVCFGFPYTHEMEVTYRIRVVPNDTGQNQDGLWKDYIASQLDYPPNVQNSGAVRVRNMWTSMILPISLLGMPGKSEWPKKRKVFTRGSFGMSEEREKNDFSFQTPMAYMNRYIYDPVCDGDIIAALVMRSLNKMAEAE
ncbi:MAG: hypothetical protein IKS20_15460 [Victivallales bacterium]|nr:hypothetical protein [Victivallales bacterium]